MKRIVLLLTLSTLTGSAMATGPAEEVSTTADTQETEAVQSKAPTDEVKGYEKWRLGGYGEMLNGTVYGYDRWVAVRHWKIDQSKILGGLK